MQLEKSCALFCCYTTQATCLLSNISPVLVLLLLPFSAECCPSPGIGDVVPSAAKCFLSSLQTGHWRPSAFWGQALHHGVSFYITFLIVGWAHQCVFRVFWKVSVGGEGLHLEPGFPFWTAQGLPAGREGRNWFQRLEFNFRIPFRCLALPAHLPRTVSHCTSNQICANAAGDLCCRVPGAGPSKIS